MNVMHDGSEERALRILYLEDNPWDRDLAARALAAGGLNCELAYARTGAEFEDALARKTFDLILSDFGIPGYGGTEALEAAHRMQPDVPFVYVSGTMGDERAVETVRSGAADYVLKDRMERLAAVVRRALQEAEVRREQKEAQTRLRQSEAELAEAQRLACYGNWSLEVSRGKVVWSDQLYRIFGVEKTQSDLSYASIVELVEPADRERVLQTNRLARTEGKPFQIQYRIRTPRGEKRVIQELGYAVRDESGQVSRLFGTAQDVTQRLEAESELRASEERFRSIWEHSIDGMRLTDQGGRMVDVNEAFCQLVRIPRERLLGEVFSVVYKGHGPNDGIEVYQRRFESGEFAPRLVARVQLWNSEELDLEISSSLIELGQRGKLLLSIFRDVTERKRSELRLEAFANLAQNLGVAKTAKEAGQVIVAIADQLLGWDACTFALYSPSENKLHTALNLDTIAGRRLECPPAESDATPSPLAQRVIAEGGQLILKEKTGERAAGGAAFGDVSRPSASILFVPIRNGASVTGVLSIQSYKFNAYDQRSLETLQALADHCGGALDRIQTQEELQATQKRLGHVLAQSPVVIYSFQTDGEFVHPDWFSDHIEQLLGFSAREACLPSWWLGQVHPQDRALVLEGLGQLIARKQISRDYRIRHRNCEYRWVRDEQRLFADADGRPMEIVGSWTDITERKQLEEQLRQAQKMEAVGQLAGGVAHDFNNLLLVMRGNAELVLLDADQHSPQTKECLKQIIAAAERAASLTRQLLAFSRKQVMQPQPLILSDVVANLTKMLRRIIGENIQLQCHYTSRLPFVQADAGMVEQVLVNLVINARDAMPKGGQLYIGTERVSLDELRARADPESRAGEFVCLRVKDTGTGIAPEHLPRIFEPFFTTKEVGKGTGLGLATAYGIVKQHQGWIEVSSQMGEGSEFRVFLPAASAPAGAQAMPLAEASLPGGNETILLVEDDYAVRMITRRVLESAGYKILEATSGPEALSTWADHASEIALLLSDIVMPQGVSGRDLAEQLCAQEPGLKVILMSGYSGSVTGKQTEFFRRIKGRFLQKPCSARTLIEAVRSCLDEGKK